MEKSAAILDSVPLIDLGRQSVAEAVIALQGSGAVAILVDETALPSGLPEPAPGELAEAEHAGPARAAGFLARRQILRAVLSASTNLNPAEIRLERTTAGAPKLVLPGHEQWFCSFSGRGDVGAVAIARCPIGIDVEEHIRAGAIPWNMLRDDEHAWLRALPQDAMSGQFAILWAAKEALTKMLGTGFAIPPEAIVVRVPASDALNKSTSERAFPDIRNACLLTWPEVAAFKVDDQGDVRGAAGRLAIAVVIQTPDNCPPGLADG